MKKILFLLVLSLSVTVLGQTETSKATAKLNRKTLESVVPLDQVIAEVQKALDKYQSNRGKGDFELPPLSSAEFDFKATTATIQGISVNLFIFKFGGSHERDAVNDVTYTYSLKPPEHPSTSLQSSTPPPRLSDKLAQMIQDAAKAVQGNGKVASLPFSKLTVNVQFGVTWDGKAEGDVPIYFVTVGLTGEAKSNSIQSVKLVFGQ